uniref:UPF0716 protein FxsA n=1 Tax=Candidatus Kentrum sp. TUN TaxID=2126343 RepID=A0A450ZBX8_9GAMM|nr:MAG: UPF0716 protein FxsA [Candidatus Kentron sp. TUN]VFK51287.1 MAG: UPF0716 protein FxsA [Candidatus Kentron sp. TUN]
MSIFHLLFLFFIFTPVVEIYFLITVGSVIGVWSTVILVILTALVGAYFVKQQGISTLFRIRDDLYYDGESPAAAAGLLEGLLILIAGAFLLTPGFLTDTAGFICLVPSWRRAIVSWFLPRWDNSPSSIRFSRTHGNTARSSGSVIEGNFRQEEE